MTTQLSQLQSAIDRKIVDELFETIPETWTAFFMLVERGPDGSTGEEMITIVNPEIAGEMMEPSDTIRASAAELAACFMSEGRAWERITYAASAKENGSWHLKITAPLPDAVPETAAEPTAPDA